MPSHGLPEVARRAFGWATVGPFRAGVVTAVGFAVLAYAATLSVGSATVAFAVALPFALVGTYAVDTAREWRDWLSAPDSPLAGIASAGGRDRPVPDTRAQLVRLRERYVEGEIDEATFERKLAALLDTETPEAARAHARRALDREVSPASDRESNPDRDPDSDPDPDPGPSPGPSPSPSPRSSPDTDPDADRASTRR